ncbi:MAG: transglutaminase domain-containing protein [Methanosphaera sp.]|nr:transglutaminase domain-containing protein [Methanosphaera sp.]
MATKSTEQVLEESAARKKIIESFRDMLTVKITIPLGDPKLKEVHTNSFIWLPLLDYMDLANYEDIMRYVMPYISSQDYIRDRWYVEAINTTNDASGKFQMELTLNPIASSGDTYRKNRTDWQKAFSDNFIVDDKHKVDIVGVTGTTSTTKTTVASTTTNTSLKGGQGTTIDNLVKNIVGMETDPLKKAKLIDKWLNQNVSYLRYCCGKYGTNAEKAYNNRTHLNCGDTAMLTTAMMRSAGLTADVVWAPGHFWTRIKINGKEYFSDQTSSSRGWNEVYHNMKYTSVKGTWCGCEAYGC